MIYVPTSADMDIINQISRTRYIKIQLLNFNMQPVEEIHSKVFTGQVNIDANSDIRRTCDISIADPKSTFNVAVGGRLWIDKYIRVFVGEKLLKTGEIKWYNLGTYIVNTPTRTFDNATNTIAFQGADLMSKMTGMRNGQLPSLLTYIAAGTPIRTAIISTLTQMGGFSDYSVADPEQTVPYDIKINAGGTVYDILKELCNLYTDYEMFFDPDGVFHYRLMPDGLTDTTMLDFGEVRRDLVLSTQIKHDFENVKNHIIVYGKLQKNGLQCVGEAIDNDPASPYYVGASGENTIYKICASGEYDYLYTQSQVDERASYELYMSARMNDTADISCVPIWWLDVNTKIRPKQDAARGVTGDYIIKSISLPLDVSAAMSINAMKIYY